MTFEEILAMEPGTIFYESEMGHNFACCVLTKPEQREGKGKYEDGTHYQQFHFEAVNIYTGRLIVYTGTKRLMHYGPRLYTEPQYARTRLNADGDRMWEYRYVGDDGEVVDIRQDAEA